MWSTCIRAIRGSFTYEDLLLSNSQNCCPSKFFQTVWSNYCVYVCVWYVCVRLLWVPGIKLKVHLYVWSCTDVCVPFLYLLMVSNSYCLLSDWKYTVVKQWRHVTTSCLKAGSQYDAGASVASGVILWTSPAASVSVTSARWRWNRNYSSITSVVFACVQPIKLSKRILNSRRSRHDAGTIVILWTRLYCVHSYSAVPLVYFTRVDLASFCSMKLDITQQCQRWHSMCGVMWLKCCRAKPRFGACC